MILNQETDAKKCPSGTDLEGVLVMNRNQCEIFSECDADSPLGFVIRRFRTR